MKGYKHKHRQHWQWDALGYAMTWCDEVVGADDACHYWKDVSCKRCKAEKPKGRK